MTGRNSFLKFIYFKGGWCGRKKTYTDENLAAAISKLLKGQRIGSFGELCLFKIFIT